MPIKLAYLLGFLTLLARPAFAAPEYFTTHAQTITDPFVPAGLKVFSNGDIYVWGGNGATPMMFRFNADLTTLDALTFANPNSVTTFGSNTPVSVTGDGTDLYAVTSQTNVFRFTISGSTLTYQTPISGTGSGAPSITLNSSGVLVSRGSVYFSESTRDFATTTIYNSGLAPSSAGLSPAPASNGIVASDTTVYYLRNSPRNAVSFRAISGTGTSSSFTLPGTWGSSPLGGKLLRLSPGGYLYIPAATTASTNQHIFKTAPEANGSVATMLWDYGPNTGASSLSDMVAMDLGPEGRIHVLTSAGGIKIYLPITAPTGVSAVASGSTVNLSWTPNVADVDTAGATIVRNTAHYPTSITDGVIAAVGQTGTSYSDDGSGTGLTGHTTYYYTIFNKTLDGYYSAATATATATTTCGAGEYDDGIGGCWTCLPVTNCASGHVTCTSLLDSTCDSCDATYYASSGACVSCSCSAGQYSTGGCSGSSNYTCASCDAITNCASGLTCTSGSDESCVTCDAGYAGTTCQYSDATTCNGHGTAQADGSCTCSTGFTGATCNACATGYYGAGCAACPTCSSHGTCADTSSGDGACTCDSGYAGNDCQYSNATTCNGHGNAQSNGSCACSTGWAGATCNACATGYYGASCTACPTCSSHGTCADTSSGDGACTCDSGYAGNNCQYSNASTCNGHGTAQANGSCTCATGFTANATCGACSAATNCASGHVTCTSSSDQVCNQCASGWYVNGQGQCQQCTTTLCGNGQYESTACSQTADRVCSACTGITHCDSAHSGAAITCSTASNSRCNNACDTDFYQVGGTTNTADSCSQCTNAASCDDAHTTCTTSSDQQCSSCDQGYFSNQGSCTQCSSGCGNGQYQTAACSANADIQCASCDASCTTCAGSSTHCLTCPSGSYLDGNSQCVTCTVCQAGQHVVSACAPSADTVCADCTAGTYSSISNANACVVCNAGRYSTTGATSCAPCAAGKFAAPGASSCSDCAAGSASQDGGASCSDCAAGTAAGAASASCTPCAAGTAATAGQASCTACSPGRFSSAPNAETCNDCPAGSFTDGAGATSCTPCPAGTAAAGPAATSCEACPSGSYSFGSAESCTSCGSCDDNDSCTTDSCNPTLGCTHVAGPCSPDGGGGMPGTQGGCAVAGGVDSSVQGLALLLLVLFGRRRRAGVS